jgi:hypothetical protein
VSAQPGARSDASVVLTLSGLDVSVATTERPWELGVDALVISVGDTLGGLAEAVRTHMPDLGWDQIRLRSIGPETPQLLATERLQPDPTVLVLASAHDWSTGRGAFTPTSAVQAMVTAIQLAARSGVQSVGLPLIGTGVLNLPVRDISTRLAPALAERAEALSRSGLREIVLFDRESATTRAIRDALSRLAPSEAPTSQEDSPASSGGDGGRQPPAPPDGDGTGGRRIYSTTELLGGISPDLVEASVEIAPEDDSLGMRPYVSMLATLIADKDTPVPLSIGIFGEWGSGKSYFMGLLRGKIAELCRRRDEKYLDRITPIAFNAWTYADANLWASLGDEIVRQLLGPGASVGSRRAALQEELRNKLEQRELLQAATDRARSEASALQAEVDVARAERTLTAKHLVQALRNSPTLRGQMGKAWRGLGIGDDAQAQGALLARELGGGVADAKALRRAAVARNGPIAVGVAVLLAVLAIVAALLAPHVRVQLGALSGVFAVTAATVTAWVRYARSGIRAFRTLVDELRSGLDGAAEAAVAPRVTALRDAQARQVVAQAQLQEVLTRVGELGRQLVELTPGARFYSFLAERVKSDVYGSNLSLVSMVRRDLMQLVELLAEHRSGGDDEAPGGRPMTDRIVLYIDDLDRCPPRRVVEVLEAVHLLLALKLFVVVIGVDPRWLLQSLDAHYSEVLGSEAGVGRATPEDYLEKIINIPLILPRMSPESMPQLVTALLAEQVGAPIGPPGSRLPPIPGDDGGDETAPAHGGAIEAGSEVSRQQIDPDDFPAPPPPPRPLVPGEVALLGALHGLIDTPRDAKRLVNVYRMIRATRDLSVASRFLGDDGAPGEFEAVIVLLGLTTFSARLSAQLFDAPARPEAGVAGGLLARPAAERWTSFLADVEPRDDVPGRWGNRIVGHLEAADVLRWRTAHAGLVQASTAMGLTDLELFQSWVPRVRRFSFILTGPA